jgi:hypothetical protein
MIWIIVIGIVLIGLIVGGVVISKKSKQNAPQKLKEAKEAYEDQDIDLAYASLQEAFYVPLNEHYKAEDAKIALEVVELLEKIGKEHYGDFQDVIDKIKPFLTKAAKSGGKVPDKYTDAVEKVLEEKVEGSYVADADVQPEMNVELSSKAIKNGGKIEGKILLEGKDKEVELNYYLISLERFNKETNDYEDELGSISISFFAKKLSVGEKIETDFVLYSSYEDFALNPDGTYRLTVEMNLQSGDYFSQKFPIEISKEKEPEAKDHLNRSYQTDRLLSDTKVAHGDQHCLIFKAREGYLISWGDMLSMRNAEGVQQWKLHHSSSLVAVNPEGTQFVTKSEYENHLKLHSMDDGQEIKEIEFSWSIDHLIWIKGYVVGFDHESLLIFDEDLNLVEYIERFSTIKDASISTIHQAFEPNKLLVNLNYADVLLEFDPSTKERKEVLRGDGFLEFIQFSNDGQVITAVEANGLHVHDSNFKLLYEVRTHGAESIISSNMADDGEYRVREFADLHPSGKKVLYNSSSGELLIGNLEKRACQPISRDAIETALHAKWVGDDGIVAISGNGEFLLLSESGKVVFKEMDYEEVEEDFGDDFSEFTDED